MPVLVSVTNPFCKVSPPSDCAVTVVFMSALVQAAASVPPVVAVPAGFVVLVVAAGLPVAEAAAVG
ncbi:hypothetical protein Apa02nite_022710 [Actinoplanes palleronii]|uniref:Uncharacterized protein n=1 Tax=Actinoplanes palleronii TaxID=113570 RepID=A0ABQ4B669_9ACTN|nr:hypothetical protein Apa02nite_022710 [Actinoplanes palleronii]